MPRANHVVSHTVISLLIFSALFYLRMIPAINNKVEFKLDCAFNYRMTEDVLRDGDVPSPDRLSTHPEGKDVKSLLPTAMYHACAVFHKTLNRFRSIPLERSILLFCAFFGSLIFIPAYLISHEIYRDNKAAYLTALLAGAIPAYLNRSMSYWYRYETIAVPILFMSLFFFIKAFDALDSKRGFIFALISAGFLTLSLYLWRLSILFLIVYTIVFLYLLMKENGFSKRWLLIFITILSIYLFLLWFVPGFGLKNPASDYGTFPRAAVQIILNKIGIRQSFTDFTRLVYYNQELGGVTVKAMFGWVFLSLSGIFIVVYLIVYLLKKSRDIAKDILFVFILFFTILTFIFSRNKVILGPLAALSLGETLDLAIKSNKRAVRYLVLSIIALALIKTGYDSFRLAATRYVNTKLDPQQSQVLDAINGLTPKRAVLHSYWADGYPIQTYCGRPTTTDGLMESPEIVKRIIEESKIYYSYSEDELWNFCKRYGVTHLLVPTNRKMAYAGYAGVEYKRYYQRNMPTPLARLTVLYKMMFAPHELTRFEKLFDNKRYVLYALR